MCLNIKYDGGGNFLGWAIVGCCADGLVPGGRTTAWATANHMGALKAETRTEAVLVSFGQRPSWWMQLPAAATMTHQPCCGSVRSAVQVWSVEGGVWPEPAAAAAAVQSARQRLVTHAGTRSPSMALAFQKNSQFFF